MTQKDFFFLKNHRKKGKLRKDKKKAGGLGKCK